ncbi:MAG: hypothetical protein HOV80_25680 [Polyangiaceae bacterium]|nr:hypothetical protein [Polyangiaceae bacterium]
MRRLLGSLTAVAAGALVAAPACGLFFEERAPTGGGDPGGGGTGGASVGFLCEDVIVRDGETWVHSFAGASLFDLRVDGAAITFVGRATANTDGGLPGLKGDGDHFFIATAARNGCDIEVQDLGSGYDADDTIRLSHGSGIINAVWTRGAALCAGDPSTLEGATETGCPGGATVACSVDAGRLRGASVAETQGGTIVSYFRDENAGTVTCNGVMDNATTLGTRLFLTATQKFKGLGGRNQGARMATLLGGDVIVTSLCPSILGTPPGNGAQEACGAAGMPGFVMVGAFLRPNAAYALDSAESPLSGAIQPLGSESTIVPSTFGAGYVRVGDAGRRLLGWGEIDGGAPGEALMTAVGQPLILRSAEAPASSKQQVLAGISHASIGNLDCPSNPCTPFAFWLAVDGNDSYGRAYTTTNGVGLSAANAAAISGDRIIVGGEFRDGALSVEGLTTRIEVGTQNALFLANVPNTAP